MCESCPYRDAELLQRSGAFYPRDAMLARF